MSALFLHEVDVTNFRSIRGHVHAPLDAKVVLIHGENGAGKTSLLSAVELALTGSIQSLRRADPSYSRQLLHRSAAHGRVEVKVDANGGHSTYAARLDESGAHSENRLEAPLSAFFSERAYLPQTLLGQLLQIYQEAGSGAGSPLAKFVGELLGLDRLDALESGLKVLVDVRNVRKIVNSWAHIENEKGRAEQALASQAKVLAELNASLATDLQGLAQIVDGLGIPQVVSAETVAEVASALSSVDDQSALGTVEEQLRRLDSITRIIQSTTSAIGPNETLLRASVAEASSASSAWDQLHAERILSVREQVNELLPLVSLPSDPSLFGTEALGLLRKEAALQLGQVAQARADIEALAKVRSQMEAARDNLDVIDEELSRTPDAAGGLGAVLSEISSYIEDNVCPVCERDFGETGQGFLSDHVHAKVRRLSDAAERLLELGRSRSELLKGLDAFGVQEQALMARILDAKTLADLERRSAALTKAAADLEAMSGTLQAGADLRAAHVAALRALSKWESESADLAAARQTLGSFADLLGIPSLAYEESLPGAKERIQATLEGEKARLQGRLQARLRGQDLVSKIRISIARKGEAEGLRGIESQALGRASQALQRGQALRDQGLAIRNSVDKVRSAIIRREFNERLNRVWRDLFVRLAPAEPFVPAFRVPSSGTQRLEPKLVTVHRDGGQDGGTPGAMLSAGNLNTAALTLFIALHLSVPTSLPWLILDDPVQSMDDVHIAHFAALLRTLSKEHGRQVVIAVHDRQLFEYLRLELSPAFVDDSLITLELTRGARRDTICMSKRWAFQEETTLRLAA